MFVDGWEGSKVVRSGRRWWVAAVVGLLFLSGCSGSGATGAEPDPAVSVSPSVEWIGPYAPTPDGWCDRLDLARLDAMYGAVEEWNRANRTSHPMFKWCTVDNSPRVDVLVAIMIWPKPSEGVAASSMEDRVSGVSMYSDMESVEIGEEWDEGTVLQDEKYPQYYLYGRRGNLIIEVNASCAEVSSGDPCVLDEFVSVVNDLTEQVVALHEP